MRDGRPCHARRSSLSRAAFRGTLGSGRARRGGSAVDPRRRHCALPPLHHGRCFLADRVIGRPSMPEARRLQALGCWELALSSGQEDPVQLSPLYILRYRYPDGWAVTVGGEESKDEEQFYFA